MDTAEELRRLQKVEAARRPLFVPFRVKSIVGNGDFLWSFGTSGGGNLIQR